MYMKKKLVLIPLLCLSIAFVNAQQDTTRKNQSTQTKANKTTTTNKNTKKTNTTTNTTTDQKNQTGTTNPTNTGTNQNTTGTTNQTSAGTTGTTGTTGNMGDASGQLTSTGRYQAMGVTMGSLHKKDMKFIMVAHSSTMLEIEASRLALQSASNQAVKDYAQMMIDHHTMSGQEMKQMLSTKGVTIPESAMLDRYRSKLEMLQGLQGADFDKAYMRIMVDAHEEDLDEYEDETTDARDADIRAFTVKMMPILRTHYTKAREIRKQL
jgi:putative membrane protein